METLRVCFVCLGNICRSPTAEAIFARDVRAAGLRPRFAIDSAGTGSWHAGEPAHAQTRRCASERGIHITHRARVFTAQDLARFDWVIAMDARNRRDLLALPGGEEARGRVHLFRSFEAGAAAGAEVPDPFYEGGFEAVFDICERASAGLLEHLRRAHPL